MIGVFKELLSKSDLSGSRSTVLKPLTWFTSILLGSIISLVYFEGPKWLIIFLTVIISLVILLFLFTYIFCLFKDRDALRSESFSIKKMEIERGIYGDSNVGILEDNDTNGNTQIDTAEDEES